VKKALLFSIAALFLAMGAAHAIEYDCGGDTTVRITQDWDKVTHDPTVTTTTLIRIESTRKSTKKRQPVIHYDIEKKKLTVNGKFCKGPNDVRD
jgi:hypothetical protein